MKNNDLMPWILGAVGIGAFLFFSRAKAAEPGPALPGPDTGAVPYPVPAPMPVPVPPPAQDFGPYPAGSPGGPQAPPQQPLPPAPPPQNVGALGPYKWAVSKGPMPPPALQGVIDFNATPRYQRTTITGPRVFMLAPTAFNYRAQIVGAKTTQGGAPKIKITLDAAGNMPINNRYCASEGVEAATLRITTQQNAPAYYCKLNPGQTYYIHYMPLPNSAKTPHAQTYYAQVDSFN